MPLVPRPAGGAANALLTPSRNRMNPLTPEQSQKVLDYLPRVREWIYERYPVASYHRDTVEANAFYALCCAVQCWKGGGEADFLKYMWKCVINGRKKAWTEEYEHQAKRDQDFHDSEDLEPLALTREPDPVELSIAAEAEQIIARRMPAMSFDDRVALTMRFLGFDTEEIADELRSRPRTVRHRVQKARERFDKLFA